MKNEISISYKEKLPQISTFLFDVDGVLTDGSVTVTQNDLLRTLNSRDCYAIQYAVKMGYTIFVLTGGSSESLQHRLEDLGVDEVILKSSRKLTDFNSLLERKKISANEVLYMGDDIPDYEVLKVVGVSTCPQDAAVEIKSICDYQSPFNGGKHCVRDVIEQTLRVQGKWFSEKAMEW